MGLRETVRRAVQALGRHDRCAHGFAFDSTVEREDDVRGSRTPGTAPECPRCQGDLDLVAPDAGLQGMWTEVYPTSTGRYHWSPQCPHYVRSKHPTDAAGRPPFPTIGVFDPFGDRACRTCAWLCLGSALAMLTAVRVRVVATMVFVTVHLYRSRMPSPRRSTATSRRPAVRPVRPV